MHRILFLAAVLTVLTAQAFALDEGQVWWGRYLDGMPTQTIGSEEPKVYNVAFRIDGSEALLHDAMIHGLRFPLPGHTSNMRSAKVWISTELPASADKADILSKSISDAALGSLADEKPYNEVVLSTPIAIPAEGLYVGYSLRVKTANNEVEKHPILVSPLNEAVAGACLMQASNGEWEDLSADYALAMQVAISGPGLPLLSATAQPCGNYIGAAGSEVRVTVPVTNTGTTAIQRIDFRVLGNDEPQTLHQEFAHELPSFCTEMLSFVVPSPDTAGSNAIALQIERINDTEVDLPQTDTLGVVAVLSQEGHRRVVMEEFTGTWCSWCPRGIAGIEMLTDLYGDDFIAIAIHRDKDPMVLDAYDYRMDWSGFPGSVINRVCETDPYASDDQGGSRIPAIFEQCRDNRLCEADIELTAAWQDAASSDLVDVDVSTTFRFSTPCSDDYALALVIVADGLTDPMWYQQNIYSGNASWAGYPYMDQFVNAPGYIVDIVFDHVPVAVSGIAEGIRNSIERRLVCDAPQHYLASLSLADNALVQDRSKLHAIAMLLYRPTGEVVNAARCPVAGAGDSAIRVVGRDAAVVRSYNLQGQPVKGVQGFTIVNGQKVVVF